MPWNPDRYHLFKRERAAPFNDLLAMVRPREGMRVIDLGCGTGELTARLADALPGSEVIGMDSSPEMLERARDLSRPGLRFVAGDLRDVEGSWDLVFSHAVIQWVDDHAALLPHLMGLVNPGGQLAVQLPSNHHHPTHLLIHATAREEPFAGALNGWVRDSPVLGVEEYAEILHACGGHDLVVLEKVYPHVLENADAMADWTSGTAMLPYFERLPAHLRDEFMASYRLKLRRRYPGSPVFYGFRRILFAAMKSEP
jgi:trans-aconitate 2-methyltransferase